MRRFLVVLSMLLFLGMAAYAAEQEKQEEPPPKWPGVDETVVGKYAKELGRPARDPYINTDQGDLLLFLFALAGTGGGFIMGYYWHKMFVAGKKDRDGEG